MTTEKIISTSKVKPCMIHFLQCFKSGKHVVMFISELLGQIKPYYLGANAVLLKECDCVNLSVYRDILEYFLGLDIILE